MLPVDLHLPSKFTSWRRNQYEAVTRTVEQLTSTRFTPQCMPVGSGKSLFALAVASWLQECNLANRALVLTPQKELQKQYMDDFSDTPTHRTKYGMCEIKGKSNYPCSDAVNRYQSNCYTNWRSCKYSQSKSYMDILHCPYRSAISTASARRTIVANYAVWMAFSRVESLTGSCPINNFDIVIADEAHEIEEEVTRFLGIQLTASDFKTLNQHPDDTHGKQQQPSQWQSWAQTSAAYLLDEYPIDIKTGDSEISELYSKLSRIAQFTTDSNWTVDTWLESDSKNPNHWKTRYKKNPGDIEFNPIRVAPYLESHLWRGAKYIIPMSGTIRPDTLSWWGLDITDPNTCSFTDWPYVFPRERAPIYYIPTVDLTDRAIKLNPSNLSVWAARCEQIYLPRIQAGLKGIIHTVSFERAKLLKRNARYPDNIIINADGLSTREAVQRFKDWNPVDHNGMGCVIVSPSLEAGYDFSHDLCRFVIMGKIPFPQSGSNLIKARLKIDRKYSTKKAAESLVQMGFRGMRSETDWCELFIIDDTFKWFKKTDYLPKWFSVREIDRVPPLLKVA